MSKYIKVICHLVEGKTIQDLAQAVDAIWGTANLEADCTEKLLPRCNTLVKNNYVAIKMPPEHAQSLQAYLDANDVSWLADWWRIEWPQYETKLDEEGSEYQVQIPYEDVTWEELITDENGDPVQFPILDPETGEPTGETETRNRTVKVGGFA